MSPTWDDVLDSLAYQVDLQEQALKGGHLTPEALEIQPPGDRLDEVQRLRAIELFERCEHLLDLATERAVAARARPLSPYRRAR